MRFTKIFALHILGALAIAAVAVTPAAAFDCPGTLTDGAQIVQGKNATTSSTEFVDVAGSDVTFFSFSPCIRVEVYGKVNAPAPQAMRVRVSLDPVPGDDTRAAADAIAPPSTTFYASSTASDGLAAVFYVRKAEMANDRTLRLQFMSVKGGTVKLDTWTVVVRSAGA